MKRKFMKMCFAICLCALFFSRNGMTSVTAASKEEKIFRTYCFGKMLSGTNYTELKEGAKAPCKDIYNYILLSDTFKSNAGKWITYDKYMAAVREYFANPSDMKNYLKENKLYSNGKVKIESSFGFGDPVSPYYFEYNKAKGKTYIKGAWLNSIYTKENWHVKNVDYKRMQVTYDNGKKDWIELGVEKYVTVILDSKGKITGYTVGNKIPISNTSITVSDCTYNKAKQTPTATIKYRGETLIKGKHYTISYSQNTNAGKGILTVTGKGHLSGKITKKFTINQAKIGIAKVTLKKNQYTYDGSKKKPGFTVYHGQTLLKEGKDYTFEYKNNKNPGTAILVVKGKGNYKGEKEITFKINKAEQNPEYTEAINSSYKEKGKTYKLNVKKAFGEVTYSTENSKIATVNKKGVVTIKGTGKTNIIVKLAGTKCYKSKTVKVPVNVLKKQSITAEDISVKYTKDLVSIKASAKGNAKLSYKSANKKVAIIKDGKLQLKGIGQTDITISAAKTDSYVSASKKIRVIVSKGESIIQAKDFNKQTTDAPFHIGATVTGDNVLSYQSSDATIATINKEGVVTLKGKEGTTVITIKAGETKLYRSAEKKIKIKVEENYRAPVDLSLGHWYALTYENHQGVEAFQKYATDWNLSGDTDKGVPVKAIADGQVVLSISDNGSIRIKHSVPLKLRSGYTYAENQWYSWYGHMRNILPEGSYVEKGDVIGYISSVAADNNHLHFSVYAAYELNGKPTIAISPCWIPGELSNKALYADDIYGTRVPQWIYDMLLDDSAMPK